MRLKRKHASLVTAAGVTLAMVILTIPAGTAPPGVAQKRGHRKARRVPGEILVRHTDEAGPSERDRARRSVGALLKEEIALSVPEAGGRAARRGGLELLTLPPGVDEDEAARELRQDPSVLYAEPNFLYEAQALVPNDPSYASQWALNNTGQFTGKKDTDIDAPEASVKETGSASVYVGVIDQGIDYNHPDLANVVINPGEDVNHDGKITSTDFNGQDDDGNGYVDDVRGWDFAGNDNGIYDPTSSYDALTDYHGTFVAGVIGAIGNNGKGVAGVNWTVRIVSGKFISGLSGTLADAVKAIDYMIDLKSRGVNIVALNNSWGDTQYSQALYDAIERARLAGILFVAAAGNGGFDAVGDNNDVTPFYPASYTNSNVLSVAAIDRWDTLARFSNYGALSVDVAAPGDAIFSTGPRGGYIWLNGTSAATPHVTGVAALLKADNPALTRRQVRNRIRNTAVVTSALTGKMVSNGRLNAYRALYNTTSVDP